MSNPYSRHHAEWAVLEDFHFETFAPHREEPFTVHLGSDERVSLTLIEATNLTPQATAAGPQQGGEAFSLIFLGPPDPRLPQRMYDFEHEALGRFPLFITAVGMQEDGVRYEAAFNRLPRAPRSTP